MAFFFNEMGGHWCDISTTYRGYNSPCVHCFGENAQVNRGSKGSRSDAMQAIQNHVPWSKRASVECLGCGGFNHCFYFYLYLGT